MSLTGKFAVDTKCVNCFCILRVIFGETLECGFSVCTFGILITHKANEIKDTESPLVLVVNALGLDLHAPEGRIFRQVK